jgi:hypothetical protein
MILLFVAIFPREKSATGFLQLAIRWAYLGDAAGVKEEGADSLPADKGGAVQHSQLVPVQVQHRRVHRDQRRDRRVRPAAVSQLRSRKMFPPKIRPYCFRNCVILPACCKNAVSINLAKLVENFHSKTLLSKCSLQTSIKGWDSRQVTPPSPQLKEHLAEWCLSQVKSTSVLQSGI